MTRPLKRGDIVGDKAFCVLHKPLQNKDLRLNVMQAHNLKVVGSNSAPANNLKTS